MICTDAFVTLAEMQAEALGCEGELELLVLQHPLAGISDDEIESRVEDASRLVLAWLERLEQEDAWTAT